MMKRLFIVLKMCCITFGMGVVIILTPILILVSKKFLDFILISIRWDLCKIKKELAEIDNTDYPDLDVSDIESAKSLRNPELNNLLQKVREKNPNLYIIEHRDLIFKKPYFRSKYTIIICDSYGYYEKLKISVKNRGTISSPYSKEAVKIGLSYILKENLKV